VDDRAGADERGEEREEHQVRERAPEAFGAEAAHEQSEGRCPAACEQAQVVERAQRDVVPAERP
jgi:hypothetical protein